MWRFAEVWVCFIYNGGLCSLQYGILYRNDLSDVSLYRIDLTFVTNLLRFVSKRLVSKRLCIETTMNPRPMCHCRRKGQICSSSICSFGVIVMSGNFSLRNRSKFVMSSSATRKQEKVDLRHDLITVFVFFHESQVFSFSYLAYQSCHH